MEDRIKELSCKYCKKDLHQLCVGLYTSTNSEDCQCFDRDRYGHNFAYEFNPPNIIDPNRHEHPTTLEKELFG